MSNENVINITEEKVVSSGYNHKFNKPFEYEGKKFTTLNFDFDKLTGQDMISIEEEMAAQSKYVITPEIDSDFMVRLAAKACGVASDALMALPLKDFSKIRTETRNFLINAGY